MRYVVFMYKDRVIEGRHPTSFSTRDPVLGPWGTGTGKRNIFERIELGPQNRVAFRTIIPINDSGKLAYVQADHRVRSSDSEKVGVPGRAAGALFVRDADEPGDSGSFLEIWSDEKVALQTSEGMFVTAEGNGEKHRLTTNRDTIGEWQWFYYKIPPVELLPEEPAEPTIGEQATGTVDKAQTKVSGIPDSPVGKVQDAKTEMERPASLRDKIFRPPGK